MSQKETVLKHLRKEGVITAREAMLRYGIGRLAARIHELREAGHPIDTNMVDVHTRDGEIIRYAEYSLESQGEVVL